ncbi:hypothetical protein Fot_26204 [Forsythia ovata]|uniref:Uncharacterized protein n=1 Tax=Forsythia ovata TaxID=205694 RepID=A0ABD1UB85_9LAMI
MVSGINYGEHDLWDTNYKTLLAFGKIDFLERGPGRMGQSHQVSYRGSSWLREAPAWNQLQTQSGSLTQIPQCPQPTCLDYISQDKRPGNGPHSNVIGLKN